MADDVTRVATGRTQDLRTLAERAIADLRATDPHEAGHVLRAIPSSIAPPLGRSGRAVLVALLVDLVQQTITTLHARVPSAACPCHRIAWMHLGALARSLDGDPCAAFADWVDAVCRAFSGAHPPTSAARAAALMRSDPAKAWSMGALAGHLRVPALTLRRDLQARFGMRASRYLQLVRAARAIALLGTDRKVEAVAWEVGYRSKKDLYAALRRWAGGTPNAVRALSDEERAWLERILVRRSTDVGVVDAGARPTHRASPRRRGNKASHRR